MSTHYFAHGYMKRIDSNREMDVSDRWLRSMVAAARSGSFSAAAAQLGVGQPAVSHAIARLEGALDTRLFDRSPAGITPTVQAAGFCDRIGAHFDEIDRAVRGLRARVDARAVTLSVSSSFASFWLLPRLPAFKRDHPGVQLRVITTDSDRAVGNDDSDLWIPLGVVTRDDLIATRFCDEEIVPVASPELASTLPTGDPRQLATAPLLHLEERYAPRFDWSTWFAHQGLEFPRTEGGGYRSNDYSLILQAALEGQGVALGWMHIVRDLLDSGRLVALDAPIRTDLPFPILERRSPLISQDGAALRDWLARLGSPH